MEIMYQVGKSILPVIAWCLLMSLYTDNWSNITLELSNSDKLVFVFQILKFYF